MDPAKVLEAFHKVKHLHPTHTTSQLQLVVGLLEEAKRAWGSVDRMKLQYRLDDIYNAVRALGKPLEEDPKYDWRVGSVAATLDNGLISANKLLSVLNEYVGIDWLTDTPLDLVEEIVMTSGWNAEQVQQKIDDLKHRLGLPNGRWPVSRWGRCPLDHTQEENLRRRL